MTGLSRSGKTAFITALVNQLLNIHTGARLPAAERRTRKRLLGVKRVPASGTLAFPIHLRRRAGPAVRPAPMCANPDARGVSEIRLALRYRSNDSLLRHFKDTSTLYPGDCRILSGRVAARPADAGAGLSEAGRDR
ncbi:YcjX family protein [Klebsiella pneumoniae subsp. pneumoniae]|nr:YcjX family protein [Klebsiella pneumoniae subsp. pneumoniae]